MSKTAVIKDIWFAEIDSANIQDSPAAREAFDIFNEFAQKHGLDKYVEGQNAIDLAAEWGTAREYQGFERGFRLGMRLARECFEATQ